MQTPVRDVRAAYETWCSEVGESPVDTKRLTQELRDRFDVQAYQSHGLRKYKNIGIPGEHPGTQGGAPGTREDLFDDRETGWYR